MKRVLAFAGVALGASVMTAGVMLAYQDNESDSGRRIVVPQVQRAEESPSATPSPPTTPTPAPTRPSGTLDVGEVPLDGEGVRFTFDGAPATPRPFYWMPGWDVQVHSRDGETWEALDLIHAQHGPNCEPPSVSHEVTAYESAVFQCRDHVMTAINAGGYGMIYLTPPYLADFSRGEAVVRFDISTLMLSTRDWWDVWLTPYEENLALPLEDWLPDVQGEPRNGIHIRLGDDMRVCPRIIRNHQATDSPSCQHIGYDSVLTPDPARRDTIEIRISRDRVAVGMPDYNLWWDDADLGGLDWDQAVVQFGHHSYNPRKDNAGEPNTWHWDNFEISPAVPFTIIRPHERSVGDEGTVTFESPAPADAMLRFAGLGKIELSFDDGETWEAAKRQAEKEQRAEHFSSYWTPIPEGTQRVQFRFQDDDWYDGPFLARDLSIWARNAN